MAAQTNCLTNRNSTKSLSTISKQNKLSASSQSTSAGTKLDRATFGQSNQLTSSKNEIFLPHSVSQFSLSKTLQKKKCKQNPSENVAGFITVSIGDAGKAGPPRRVYQVLHLQYWVDSTVHQVSTVLIQMGLTDVTHTNTSPPEVFIRKKDCFFLKEYLILGRGGQNACLLRQYSIGQCNFVKQFVYA